MDPFTWVSVGLAGLGAISSIIGGNKADKAARKAAKKEAALEERVTSEKLRQLHVEERITKGETIAGYAGSRVKVNRGADIAATDPSRSAQQYGSPLQIMAESAREFAYERLITEDVGATKASQALQGGRDVGSRYKHQGQQSALGSLASIFSLIGSKT